LADAAVSDQLGDGLDDCAHRVWRGARMKHAPPSSIMADCAAELPHLADVSDVDFFRAHPGINERTRLPFAHEFPPDVMSALGRTAMIRVVVKRNPITHEPTIWRNLFHVDGGHA
jgi:hypothetical protein